MQSKHLKAGEAYIWTPRRSPAWRDHTSLCSPAVVVDADLSHGVVVDLERPAGDRPGTFRPAERVTVRAGQIVAPWSEMAQVREREAARLEAARGRERERLARHALVVDMIGRLGSLEADDVDVSWDGERVTLPVGVFLGMAGLAVKALS